ncbi:hypothetical protein BCR35DRAFT_335125 [Leucosporidium creatinivorum]|uniref:Uncharacterized protein n=1 Tax=Leucosporidium creatinivorum TaxID=106004 RepID=A0A1Y2DIH5_9BASI|nr:hypothetical protein BCR35DRAFT_335125 [Leucosporidium creatinivorum]
MPITEQEALAWTGPTAADSLVPLPTERLTAATMRLILDFSTEVIHCFIAGGASPPLFALAARVDGSRDLMNCCRRVLERDNSKRRTCDEAPSPDYVAGTRSTQDSFLRTFGHQHEIGNLGGYPFIKLMFHPQLSADMHAYISEAVRIMMSYVTSRRSFITLLYAGSRDWQTCSAWTRGKVLLVARSYREVRSRRGAREGATRTSQSQ